MSTSPLTSWPPRTAEGALLPLVTVRKALIEASAGTGKTYQTEGLIVRLVVEQGVSIDRILVITFTRAATAELKTRVRSRLAAAREALSGRTAPPTEDRDEVVASLCVGDHETKRMRLARIEAALRDYDLAPISTIHGFCQRILETEAFAAREAPSAEIAADPAPLRQRFVTDVLCGAYAHLDIEQVAVLGSVGLSVDAMLSASKTVTAAGNERCDPGPSHPASPEPSPLVAAAREAAIAQIEAYDAALAWLDRPEGQAAEDAVRNVVNRASHAAPGKEYITGLTKDRDARLAELRAWIAGRGLTSPSEELSNSLFKLREHWNDGAEKRLNHRSFEESPFFPLARVIESVMPGRAAWLLPDFAAAARLALEHDLQTRGVLTYDAMIVRLAAQLQAEEGCPEDRQHLRNAMRKRYDAALVDEFQDTDESQWTILRRVFLESASHFMYLVGDPKQAIYRFRGANIGVYLAAVRHMESVSEGRTVRYGLLSNRRSDPALIGDLNTLWAGLGDAPPFHDARITFAPVEAFHLHARCAELGKPLEYQAMPANAKEGDVPGLAAAFVKTLLAPESPARIGVDPKATDPTGSGRALRASDIAILCRTHRQAAALRGALETVGITARTSGSSSIFNTDAASWFVELLDAIASPTHEAPTRRLALTPLIGWAPTKLALAIEKSGDTASEWAALRDAVVCWAARWPTAGFRGVFDALRARHDVFARLLATRGEERDAADLQDLSERLHRQLRISRAAPAGLAAWLREQIANADDDDEGQAATVESDREAVIISTVHAAKGLQFPVVLLPYLRNESGGEFGSAVVYTPADPAGASDGSRTVDLHPEGHPERVAAKKAADAESTQEAVRLAYVATTRAIHKLVVWSGPRGSTDCGKVVGHLAPAASLFADPPAAPTMADNASKDDRKKLPPPAAVTPWKLEKALGAGWRVTSFTGLSSGRGVELDGEDPDSDEPPERIVAVDEQDASTFTPAADDADDTTGLGRDVARSFDRALKDASLTTPAPGEGFFRGTKTGTWLHHLFEDIDFTMPPTGRDGRSLADVAAERGDRDGVTDKKQLALAERLMPVWLETPLDADPALALPPGFTLSRIGLDERLDELAFDLKLAGGLNRARAGTRLPGIDPAGARCVYENAKNRNEKAAPWLSSLLNLPGKPSDDGSTKERNLMPGIAGMLTGSMDLVFRVGPSAVESRYYVCDYKSNALVGGPGVRRRMEVFINARRDVRVPVEAESKAGQKPLERAPMLLAAHYTEDMMAWGMAHAAYHLQALVYTVALHRHLKLRLGSHYEYEKHIGGHLYLFLRGMHGAKAPAGHPHLGVWADRWSEATVLGMDMVLEGRGRREVEAAQKEMNRKAEEATRGAGR